MQSAECPNRTQRRRGRNWRPPSECATDVEIGLLPSACGGTHAISSGLFRPSGSDGFIPMAVLHLQLQERQGADLGTSRPAYCMSQCLIINLSIYTHILYIDVFISQLSLSLENTITRPLRHSRLGSVLCEWKNSHGGKSEGGIESPTVTFAGGGARCRYSLCSSVFLLSWGGHPGCTDKSSPMCTASQLAASASSTCAYCLGLRRSDRQ